MRNFELARLFDQMADVLELRGDNPFRIRAYRRAARNLEALAEDVEAVAREGRLEGIPGVGRDLAEKIAEYLSTGRIGDLETARRGVPPGVVDLLNVPGIGPKTARLLHEKGGVTSLEQLERMARAGKLRGHHGIQAKTEANILRGLALLHGSEARMPLGRALVIARELEAALRSVPSVTSVQAAGSLRRMRETVGDIDLLATSARSTEVMQAFTSLPQVGEVLERGATKASIRHREGIQVDLRVVPPASLGAALVYFTGAKQHNIRIRELAGKRKLKVNEYGVFRASDGRRMAGETEEDVYATLGLAWIPPELREDGGEVEAAARGELPRLVELGDVRGDLHCHTNASDGHHTIEALVQAAIARGYEYVAITDHSRSARIAGGLDVAELAAHVGRIRAVQRRYSRITVLAGTECDILSDGALDYPDDALADLDLVVAAVHSRFKQPREHMTRRLCTALAHPSVRVLAHPTGRLLGEREPYDVDLEEVLRTATAHDRALELNAYPLRMDLNDVQARRARDLGALIAVDTDAHVLDHLATMELGIGTARRGWLEPDAIVNTWPTQKLLAWARRPRSETRRRAGGATQ